MTRLPYSENLYQVLFRVSEGRVVLHDSCEVHPQGWSWVQSDMSPMFQELCAGAFHARFIELGMHQPWGTPVSLSSAGWTRFFELRDRRMADLRGVPA